MIQLPEGWRGAQKAIVLAGVLWSCTLHLGVAQKKISLALEPPNPQAGQDVTLAVRGGSRHFTLCEWYRELPRGDLETILEYIPGPPPRQRNGTGHSGRETARADCSLRIVRLKPSDTGNYSANFEVKHDSGQSQQTDEFYEGSVYLDVSGSAKITIAVLPVPQRPNQGEEVTLTPQGAPRDIVFCEWFKKGSSGNPQSIIQYRPKQQQSPPSGDAGSRERVTVGPTCALRLTKLSVADSGTYTVNMQVLLDPQQQEPGQGSRPQEPDGIQEYWGQVELQVNQGSTKDHQKAGSAGLRCSAGIIAGALLAFAAWADTFASLCHLLGFASLT